MKEFIEFIAKHLVDSPDSVSIEESVPNENTVELVLKVGPDDVGKVIGKQGKTAQAMRTLLTAIAAKEGKRAILKIESVYAKKLAGQNVAGIIFALKNMGWKDKTETEHSGLTPIQINFIEQEGNEPIK